MSALPPKADIERFGWNVRFVPMADTRVADQYPFNSANAAGVSTGRVVGS
jgi:hypothetical protein